MISLTNNKLKLGDYVKDTISGFEGYVTAITEWLYGCRRMGVQPKGLFEGKPIEAQWFDEALLEKIKIEKSKEKANNDRGGPRKDPIARRSGE